MHFEDYFNQVKPKLIQKKPFAIAFRFFCHLIHGIIRNTANIDNKAHIRYHSGSYSVESGKGGLRGVIVYAAPDRAAEHADLFSFFHIRWWICTFLFRLSRYPSADRTYRKPLSCRHTPTYKAASPPRYPHNAKSSELFSFAVLHHTGRTAGNAACCNRLFRVPAIDFHTD